VIQKCETIKMKYNSRLNACYKSVSNTVSHIKALEQSANNIVMEEKLGYENE
jgi:hypothetical protein